MTLDEFKRVYDFSNQTIVVTGATGVLGGEIALALGRCGANIVALHQTASAGEELKQKFGADAGKLTLFIANVTDRDALDQTAKKVLEKFGRIDGLINAAGGNKPQATASADQKFFDLPADALRWVFDLNLVGTILPCQVFGRHFAEHKRGTILNVSSMSAVRPLTRVVAYGNAKAAVNNFTQWLAVHMAMEYSPEIRVNAIAPGFFLTKQNKFLLTDKATGEPTPRGKSILAHTPMGRFGSPGDLIGATLWLMSPASAFVTGTVIPIDGGFSAFSGV
jgi:NAD(P)-dependent dehydrogenase (short-subunit alcohol dehydrogenase family)